MSAQDNNAAPKLLQGQVTAGTSVTNIPVRALGVRRTIVQNTNTLAKLYVGAANTVTASTGVLVGPGTSVEFRTTAALYLISDTASTDVRWFSESD